LRADFRLLDIPRFCGNWQDQTPNEAKVYEHCYIEHLVAIFFEQRPLEWNNIRKLHAIFLFGQSFAEIRFASALPLRSDTVLSNTQGNAPY